MARIEIDARSWAQGFVDGELGRVSSFLRWQPAADSYSYASGYIEGHAKRDGYEVCLGADPAAMQQLIDSLRPEVK